MAYWMEQAETCQLCGTAEWEWKDNRYAYVTQEKFCQGCYNKHFASEGAGSMPGTTIELVTNTPKVKAQSQLLADRLKQVDVADEEVELDLTVFQRQKRGAEEAQ